MGISKETVEYVAHLARIELMPVELERLSRQLEVIIEFIDALKKVDVSSVAPTSHILPIQNVTREDTPAGSLPIEKVLVNAPLRQNGFFVVPKVIEDNP
ncbi:MAG: Asp-tRNA(Asn)/Glu-tRNA(Gln) amidotransferase subunit GatC [Candidatus Omnitrophota bacterium]